MPRAATIVSVLDRGVSIKGAGLTFEQAKAVINDTMIAVGGTEAGVLDEAGNQLNPKVEGAGALSLTQEGVEGHSKALMLGDTYTLRDFVDALKGAFRFPLGLEIGHVVQGFQAAVDEAWAKPNDPGSAMAIVLFNEGVTLSSMPPIITPDTRFNRFQVFLLVSSFLVFNQSTLEPSIEGILRANGIDYESLLPPPKFSQCSSREPESSCRCRADRETSGPVLQPCGPLSGGLVLPTPAYADNPCGETSPLCKLEDLTAKKTFSKAWRMIGANAIAEAAGGALFAAGLTFLQQSVMSYVMASSGGRFGTAIAVLNLAAASVQGFVAVLTYKLVIGWYLALVAASFEPPPAEGRDNYIDNNGNFVINFDLSPEHKRIASLPDSGKLKRNFAYHLYRFPNCAAPVDASNSEYMPLKAEPDYGHSDNKKGPPYLGTSQICGSPTSPTSRQ